MTADPSLDDLDNPEWTEADFARAGGSDSLSAKERDAFHGTLPEGPGPHDDLTAL